MTRSAPSRFAAITPHRPTAPSPTTATVFPGPTSAATAAWWPVPITSESVSSDGISASSRPTGSTTSVPSACGTRKASPCPPSTSSRPYLPPCRHSLCRPSWQNTQVPSDHRNGETTTSPALTVRTSVPTASTTPMNSWPMRRPVSLCSIVLYGQRSLPQMAARADGDEGVGLFDQVGVRDGLDADVAGAIHDSRAHPDLPRASSRLDLVERQRRRQLTEGIDLLLKHGDLLLGQGDRVGAGDEAARRLLLVSDSQRSEEHTSELQSR